MGAHVETGRVRPEGENGVRLGRQSRLRKKRNGRGELTSAVALLGCDRSSDLILLLLLLSEILTAPGQTTSPSPCKKPEAHLHIISVKFWENNFVMTL